MSLLYRNGTGRNNIAWGGGTTTSGNYLRRTGTSRNSISFIQISSNGTWNILNRINSGRNNIAWQNTTFNFKSAYELMFDEIMGPVFQSENTFHMSRFGSPINGSDKYKSGKFNWVKNSAGYYSLTLNTAYTGTILNSGTGAFGVYCTDSDAVISLRDHLKKYVQNSNYYIKMRYMIGDYNTGDGTTKTGNLYLYNVSYQHSTELLIHPSEKVNTYTSNLWTNQETLFYYK